MKQSLIQSLNLTPHIEGGYFTRTYQSPIENDTRPLMTSIFYMLTSDRPIGHFHKNKSDIMHYFHLGSPMTYLTISPEGILEKNTKYIFLGPQSDLMPTLLFYILLNWRTWGPQKIIEYIINYKKYTISSGLQICQFYKS